MKNILGVVFIVIMMCFLSGCATQDRSIHKVVQVTFELHIVGDRTMFDWPEAQVHGGPAGRTIGAYASSGDAERPHRIWLRGYRDKDGFQIDDDKTLGHEVREVLRYIDPSFADLHK
jgi:hypothetical protein